MNILTILPEEVSLMTNEISWWFHLLFLVFAYCGIQNSTCCHSNWIRSSIPYRYSSLILINLSHSLLVLTYIQFIIATYHQTDILGKMFSCLSKWLEFGISIIKVETMFDYLFQSLNNESIFDHASDCIIVLFSSPDALK